MSKDLGPNNDEKLLEGRQTDPEWDEAPTNVREPSDSQLTGGAGEQSSSMAAMAGQKGSLSVDQLVHEGPTFSGEIPLTTSELKAVLLAEDPPTIPGTKDKPEQPVHEAGFEDVANSSVKTVVSVPPKVRQERLGGYPLIDTLGSGGMAIIYKSKQISLDRTVALKVLKPAVAEEEQFSMRFAMEAETLAGLQHENIVQIFDHRRDDGLSYMVMEYVEGIDLFDLMDRCGPLPPDVTAIIALHVARALEHIHYRGIVHRDIKPANIMVSYSGVTKLMDFGIARIDQDQDLTQHGMGLGTPSYMSPEQVLGDRLDGRTDIFSLGTVMFQMVTGRRPFVEDDQETVLQKIRSNRAPRARKFKPDLPRDLDRIIGRCHQRKPGDRYWPTRELVRALERFLAAMGVESENVTVVRFLADRGIISPETAEKHLSLARRSGYRATKPVRHPHTAPTRRPALLVAGLVLVAALAFGAGWFLAAPAFRSNDDRGRAPSKPAKRSPRPQAAPGHVPYRGGIQVLVRPWAEVWADGRRLGTTPLAQPIHLPPGKHTVKLVNPYCKDKTVPVTIKEGRTVRIKETLDCTPRPGRPPAR